jgi:hypothetical protein
MLRACPARGVPARAVRVTVLEPRVARTTAQEDDMTPRPLIALALAAGLSLPALALASPSPVSVAPAGPGADLMVSPLTLGLTFIGGGPATTSEVRYRPRTRGGRYDRGPMSPNPVQLHIGFFDPGEASGESFVLGMRAGPQVDPNVQIGAAVDWIHRADDSSAILSEGTGPGGTTITTRQQISHSSSSLLPVMAFAQVSGDPSMSAIPYGGIGGGYEVLFLSATDYLTGDQFDGTFGGWAWQAWGGVAIPLSGQARVNGEVFVNRGEVSRDTDGPAGITYHETVDVNGVGLRVGLSWGF